MEELKSVPAFKSLQPQEQEEVPKIQENPEIEMNKTLNNWQL